MATSTETRAAAMRGGHRARAEMLARDLPLAAARGQLLLHYQPKIDLLNSHLSGFEGLVRWQHPILGRIPPDDFIGQAERTGDIGAIGSYVRRASFAFTRRSLDELGYAAPVAVNVSATEICEPGFADAFLADLVAAGIPRELVHVEITETSAVSDMAIASSNLLAFRASGIEVALDDFGAGHSSLGVLRSLPIDVIKLDRSFISPVATDPRAAHMVKSVVTMAQGLALKVVAEGVETIEQAVLLTEIGCDIGQGFLFGRPVDSCAAKSFLIRTP